MAKPKPKKISGLTAAFMVLVDADRDMSVKEIVAAAAEKGWRKSDAAASVGPIVAEVSLMSVARGVGPIRGGGGRRVCTVRWRQVPAFELPTELRLHGFATDDIRPANLAMKTLQVLM